MGQLYTDVQTALRERKLVQWALAYLAGAWVVLQVAGELRDTFAWPPVIVQVLTVLLVVGFFAALVIAWYHGERGHQRVTGMEVLMLTALLVSAGAAVALVRGEIPPEASLSSRSETTASAAAFPLPAAAEKSIAVIPFTNLSESKENEYFSDGITEDILTRISRIQGLRVISRTSVMGYKGTTKKIPEIGAELGVTHVLEGSVRRAGNQVRIVAQLIDARTDEHLWAETYDRELKDIFAIQSEIAQQIAAALQARLSPEEQQRITVTATGNLTAYDLYLRGREYLYGPGRQEIENAIALFKQAIELDPRYARAYAGLALAYVSPWAPLHPARVDSAAAASRRAIELAPDLAEGYAALGTVYRRRGQLREAREQFQRAVQLNPNHATAVAGIGFVHRETGRPDEALPWFKRGVTLDPTNPARYRQVGSTYAMLGELEEAEQWLQQASRLQPDNPHLHGDLVEVYLLRREWENAAVELREVLSLAPEEAWAHRQAGYFKLVRGNAAAALRYYEKAASLSTETPSLEEGYLYWKLGEREKARRIFDEHENRARRMLREQERRAGQTAEDVSNASRPYRNLARIHAARGERDQALRWLEQAVEHGGPGYHYAQIDPLWNDLRGDPRFQQLLSRAKANLDRLRARVQREGW